MSIKPHIIGFLGIDSYDLILYLAKYLNYLGQRVLLADYSRLGRLSFCIPTPVSLNPDEERITYKNMDFVRYKEELSYKKEYNYILMDFGWDSSHRAISSCEFLYIITDLQQQNIEHILKMKFNGASVYVILKNIFHTNNSRTIKDYLNENHFDYKNCYLYPTTEVDMENMVMLQYNHDIQIKKVSRQLKNLIDIILIDNLEFEEKEVIRVRKFKKK